MAQNKNIAAVISDCDQPLFVIRYPLLFLYCIIVKYLFFRSARHAGPIADYFSLFLLPCSSISER